LGLISAIKKFFGGVKDRDVSGLAREAEPNRPLLTVEYVPAGSTNLTGAGVTVAVIDSGMLQDGGANRIKTTRDFTGGNANPAAPGMPDFSKERERLQKEFEKSNAKAEEARSKLESNPTWRAYTGITT